MTHIKRQKLISSTQVLGYNMQFLLYPFIFAVIVQYFMLFLLLTPVQEAGNLFPNQISIKYFNPRLR